MSNTGTEYSQGTPEAARCGQRKTGRAYRRRMRVKHNKKRIWIIHNCRYNPCIGHVDWERVDGVWQSVGKYVKYPQNSDAQRYWKRHSNRIIRRRKEIFRGNQYRKCFAYWWMLY